MSCLPRAISTFALAITKSHLNAKKQVGQKEMGLKGLNLQIIHVIKQEKEHTKRTHKAAHTSIDLSLFFDTMEVSSKGFSRMSGLLHILLRAKC